MAQYLLAHLVRRIEVLEYVDGMVNSLLVAPELIAWLNALLKRVENGRRAKKLTTLSGARLETPTPESAEPMTHDAFTKRASFAFPS